MTDSIVVRGIKAQGRHGLVGERDHAQTFVVDVDIFGDLRPAASADNLDATIDYSVVTCEVRDIIESRSFELIESLAQAIADRLLEVGAGSLRVRVSKPRAAEALGVDEVAVVVER